MIWGHDLILNRWGHSRSPGDPQRNSPPGQVSGWVNSHAVGCPVWTIRMFTRSRRERRSSGKYKIVHMRVTWSFNHLRQGRPRGIRSRGSSADQSRDQKMTEIKAREICIHFTKLALFLTIATFYGNRSRITYFLPVFLLPRNFRCSSLFFFVLNKLPLWSATDWQSFSITG